MYHVSVNLLSGINFAVVVAAEGEKCKSALSTQRPISYFRPPPFLFNGAPRRSQSPYDAREGHLEWEAIEEPNRKKGRCLQKQERRVEWSGGRRGRKTDNGIDNTQQASRCHDEERVSVAERKKKKVKIKLSSAWANSENNVPV